MLPWTIQTSKIKLRRFIATYPQLTSSPTLTRRLVLRLPNRKPIRCSPGIWACLQGLKITIGGRARIQPLTEKSVLQGVQQGGGGQVVDLVMPKAGFYAVAAGRKTGIFSTWAECEDQVKGYNGARYKKFKTEAEARQYIAANSTSSVSARPIPASTPVEAFPSTIGASSSRASSPPAHASAEDLSDDLAKLAEKGWKFSRRKPTALVVYTDGSGLGNGKQGARAGLGVWWSDRGDAAKSNLSERVPGELQTNNRGELLSVIRAIESCPLPDLPLEIRTDSQYTIMCMTSYLPNWIKNGFLTSNSNYVNGKRSTFNQPQKIKNADMIKHLLVLLRRRGGKAGVRFKYVPGHAGVQGNEGADLLARMGAALMPLPDRDHWLDPDDEDAELPLETSEIDLEIDESWLMTPEELAQFEDGFQEVEE